MSLNEGIDFFAGLLGSFYNGFMFFIGSRVGLVEAISGALRPESRWAAGIARAPSGDLMREFEALAAADALSNKARAAPSSPLT